MRDGENHTTHNHGPPSGWWSFRGATRARDVAAGTSHQLEESTLTAALSFFADRGDGGAGRPFSAAHGAR